MQITKIEQSQESIRKMTKEELEKEAKESWWNDDNCSGALPTEKIYECGYLASAEPREKQIQIDAEHIIALQKQNGELTDKVKELEEKLANADYQLEGRDLEIKELEQKLETERNSRIALVNKIAELEAQIEKMKCCENCKYYNNHYNEVVCKRQVINCKRILRQATRDQWEIKEK